MSFRLAENQYVDRESGRIHSERPFADWLVNSLYCQQREQAGFLFNLLVSYRFSHFLGWAGYDFPLGPKLSGIRGFMERCAIDWHECLEAPEALNTARRLFERKIRYWECRPMSGDSAEVICPADCRLLLGSLKESSSLFLKGKLFDYEELLGSTKAHWLNAFRDGDFAICRLTPDKYHYNHTPVAGVVREFYTSDGAYHSCNPGPVLTVANPYSKNRRAVTIIDTDVAGGSHVGLIAMIEIVALMIGDIAQCYSREKYENPQPVESGVFLKRGCPKSLFRPGSSTTVLLLQQGRVEFSCDLMRNLYRNDVESRYAQGLGRPLVETDIKVRSTIGTRVP